MLESSSSSQKALAICWLNAIKGKPHDYLRVSQIVDLIHEIEIFFGAKDILKLEERKILEKMVLERPQLMLHRAESMSFLLRLVHCDTLDKLFKTRCGTTPMEIAKLVESYPTGNIDADFPSFHSGILKSLPTHRRRIAERIDAHTDHSGVYTRGQVDDKSQRSKFFYGDSNSNAKVNESIGQNQARSHSAWLPKWAQRFGGEATEDLSVKSSEDSSSRENPVTICKSFWKNFISPWLDKTISRLPFVNQVNGGQSYLFTQPDLKDLQQKSVTDYRSIKELQNALSDLQSYTNRLEIELRERRENPNSKLFNDLEAAVRDQDRLIARLERKLQHQHKSNFVHMNGLWGLLDTWGESGVFSSGLPLPKVLTRVITAMLSFIVCMNFVKMIYFLLVASVFSGGDSYSYIFDSSDNDEQAIKFSWIQEFPTLEYAAYRFLEWADY